MTAEVADAIFRKREGMIDKDGLSEAFEAWRTLPMTQTVMQVLEKKAEEAKERWIRASWVQGKCDEIELRDLAASASAWLYVTDLDAQEIEDILYAEPERN